MSAPFPGAWEAGHLRSSVVVLAGDGCFAVRAQHRWRWGGQAARASRGQEEEGKGPR